MIVPGSNLTPSSVASLISLVLGGPSSYRDESLTMRGYLDWVLSQFARHDVGARSTTTACFMNSLLRVTRLIRLSQHSSRVKAELLVIYQRIAKHDTENFESLLVDIEEGRSRAA